MARFEMLRAGLDSGSESTSAGRVQSRSRTVGRKSNERDSCTSIRAAAALTLIALVAACSPPPPVVAPVVVAPMPRAYTCQQSRQLANEFAALPAGAMLRVAIIDYGQVRDELRAVHGLPKPAPCP